MGLKTGGFVGSLGITEKNKVGLSKIMAFSWSLLYFTPLSIVSVRMAFHVHLIIAAKLLSSAENVRK